MTSYDLLCWNATYRDDQQFHRWKVSLFQQQPTNKDIVVQHHSEHWNQLSSKSIQPAKRMMQATNHVLTPVSLTASIYKKYKMTLSWRQSDVIRDVLEKWWSAEYHSSNKCCSTNFNRHWWRTSNIFLPCFCFISDFSKLSDIHSRVVQTEAILILESMSEWVGSDV